jgi:hypothetical protein
MLLNKLHQNILRPSCYFVKFMQLHHINMFNFFFIMLYKNYTQYIKYSKSVCSEAESTMKFYNNNLMLGVYNW